MRFLVSFVNSTLSLAGVDWPSCEVAWSVPTERFRACGICYHSGDLVIASDNVILRVGPEGELRIPLPGRTESLAHSVHPIDEDTIGIADTGHSCLRFFNRSGRHIGDLSPLVTWETIPPDAIHLNDFAPTPWGIIASCFDFRPWRNVRQAIGDDTRRKGSGCGLLLNLTDVNQVGRIVACGLDHPHSLIYRHPDLVHCSSSTGTLHFWQAAENGVLVESRRRQITDQHFLRGALPVGDHWYLGGSVARHGPKECDHMAIYRYSEADDTVESQSLPLSGEIYDILPWRDEIMTPVMRLLR